MDLERSVVTKPFDAFICHANEDKDDFVRPLAEALKSHHLKVWYDEFALDVGDSLREAIDRGLTESRYGIVVLSPSFSQALAEARTRRLGGTGDGRGSRDDPACLAPCGPRRGPGILAPACGSARRGILIRYLERGNATSEEASARERSIGGGKGHAHRERTVATDSHG